MNPDVWGPHGWFFIQSVILAMNEDDDPSNYVNFLFSLQYVLPCEKCRENYADWVRANPIPTKKDDMLLWIVSLQNSIRESKGKPSRSVQEVSDYYLKNRTRALQILLVIALLVFIVKKI